MNLEEFIKMRKEYEQLIHAEAKKLFEKMFTEFFYNNPEFTKVSWAQYTPFFNDGDACVFRINTFAFCPKGKEEEFDEEPYEFDLYSFKENTRKKLQAFEENVHKIGENFFLNNFGDHSRVTVSYDGNFDLIITADSYDHE